MDCRIALGVCFGKMQVSLSPISQYSVEYINKLLRKGR